MVELVHAISSLCKLLGGLLNIELKPEFFRLSKRNKLNFQETQLFWTVLHRLTCFSANSSCQKDAFKCISSHVLKEGGTISPDSSSRELLLCFGWFLSQGIIESIIDKLLRDSMLGEEFFFKSGIPNNSESPERPSLQNEDAQLKYALFLIGKINHNIKAIANFRQEELKIFFKIHEASVGFQGLPHLSTGDVQIMMTPELLPDLVVGYHPLTKILEDYFKWWRKCDIFWEWMNSVLKEERSTSTCDPLSAECDQQNIFIRELINNHASSATEESGQLEKSHTTFSCITSMRRMNLSKNLSNMDSVIEDLNQKIEALTKRIESKNEQIHNKISKKISDKCVRNVSDVFFTTILDELNCDFRLCSTSSATPPLLPNLFKELSLSKNQKQVL